VTLDWILDSAEINGRMMTEVLGVGLGLGAGGSSVVPGMNQASMQLVTLTHSQPGHENRLGDFLRTLKCSGYKKVQLLSINSYTNSLE